MVTTPSFKFYKSIHWFQLFCSNIVSIGEADWCLSDLSFSMATKQRTMDTVPVSKVSSQSANASVEGVLTRISPMKKTRMSTFSFFDGNISDVNSTLSKCSWEAARLNKDKAVKFSENSSHSCICF